MGSNKTVRQNHTARAYQQSGFTLIELMISLVLGLIISAAAMQVYIINVKTSSIQASGSELQDASVFGIQQLERKVRLANLGTPENQITSATNKGGVVLTAANLGATEPYADTGYLTRRAGDTSAGTNRWTGISNIDSIPSDQLTIQYNNITGDAEMTDCEANKIELNHTVVERYFLRPETDDSSKGAIKKLVLACDAGRVNVVGGVATGLLDYPATDTRSFGGAGQEFVANADQFKVLLGVHFTKGANAGQMMYLPSSAYMAIAGDDKPAITAIKMGLIVHGNTPIVGSEDQSKFTLLGETHNLKTDATRKNQVRNTYETTTLLRNARVVNIDTSLNPQ